MMNYLNTYRRYACDINRINYEAGRNPEEFVMTTENLIKNEFGWIVSRILSTPEKRHVVLLSGPSSSGKTTSAQKLSDEFRNHGIDVKHISMDDFYLGMDFVDRLLDGKPDFESVNALDIPLIKETIKNLINTGECIIPQYDFAKSRRTDKTKELKLTGDSAVIIEGIHALNPIFNDGVSGNKVVKIYVSVKQGIKDNEDYVLTNRDIRLIRRLIRDSRFRKTDPEYMLSMWDTVVDGEMKYIRPFRYTSDFTINSIHIYEPCVMKETALPLLKKIGDNHEEYANVQRLISSLSRFETIDKGYVPDDSLIREFIGGGCYHY